MLHPRPILLAVAAALLGAGGLVAPTPQAAAAIPTWLGGSEAPAGTPEWWKKHKNEAVFEVGKGYMVPGFEGYYDEKGRPITAPVDELVRASALSGEQPKGLLPGLDPKLHYNKVKEAVGLGPNQEVAKAAMAEGDRLFVEKDYKRAAEQYREAADRWPNSPIDQRALFLLGECHFWRDEYIEARDTYDELVSKHPNTRDLDTLIERQWSIAQYWERHHFDKGDIPMAPNLVDETRPRFDTIGQAIKTYDNIRLNDPTGPRADDAIMATAGVYFRQARFADADHHYTLLRRDYPRSEHQFNAHLLGLQAKLRRYQGPDYDGTSLEEAKELAKQIKVQFAGRLTQEEKDRLRDVQAQLIKEVELRELKMAEYYDNTKYFGAARDYYQRLATEHPESPVGTQARERAQELSGLPEKPPKRLAWLVDVFPESSERSTVSKLEKYEEERTRLAQQAQGGSAPDAQPTTTR